jgi:hypothetical protein
VFPEVKELETTRPDCALMNEPVAALAVRTVGIIAPARSASSRAHSGEVRVDFFRIPAPPRFGDSSWGRRFGIGKHVHRQQANRLALVPEVSTFLRWSFSAALLI